MTPPTKSTLAGRADLIKDSSRKKPNIHLIHLRYVAWARAAHKTVAHVGECELCDINSLLAALPCYLGAFQAPYFMSHIAGWEGGGGSSGFSASFRAGLGGGHAYILSNFPEKRERSS